MTALDWIKFILFIGVPNLPSFFLNRTAVTDARLREVSLVSTAVSCHSNILDVKFLATIREKRGYTMVGAVG